MLAFSTPFDDTAVDFLESLDVPAYKIASFENTDLPLIRRVAATGKPLIISTGMASIAELDETVRAAREAGCKDLVLLKCTSTYPATPANSNVRTIPHLRELFGCEVGLVRSLHGRRVSRWRRWPLGRRWWKNTSPSTVRPAASMPVSRWNLPSWPAWWSKPSAPGRPWGRCITASPRPSASRWCIAVRCTSRRTWPPARPVHGDNLRAIRPGLGSGAQARRKPSSVAVLVGRLKRGTAAGLVVGRITRICG